MSKTKLHVLALVGGASPEHSISLRSGATVVRALEAAGHRVTTVAITLGGLWKLSDLRPTLARAETELIELDDNCAGDAVVLAWDARGARLLGLDGGAARPAGSGDDIDVVFPVLHGPGGEDGTVQGLLEVAGVPFVGAGTTASAIAMDKLAMKTLCAGAGIPQVEFLNASGVDAPGMIERIESAFGFPCFVKPANLGSSVGISKVDTPAGLAAALDEARRYDSRVVVERAVVAREIEVAILGPELSPPGEIVAAEGFYDFDTKYVDAGAAGLVAPADLDAATVERIREIAERAWNLIGGGSMARADFFVERGSEAVYLNEINTIPGFTEISMYPRLWKVAGLSTPELVDRLLDLAIERRASR